MFSTGQYMDYSTGRKRWAVYCSKSETWYFPDRYGKKAAEKLCAAMNKI